MPRVSSLDTQCRECKQILCTVSVQFCSLWRGINSETRICRSCNRFLSDVSAAGADRSADRLFNVCDPRSMNSLRCWRGGTAEYRRRGCSNRRRPKAMSRHPPQKPQTSNRSSSPPPRRHPPQLVSFGYRCFRRVLTVSRARPRNNPLCLSDIRLKRLRRAPSLVLRRDAAATLGAAGLPLPW